MTDQATQDALTLPDNRPAVVGPVERPIRPGEQKQAINEVLAHVKGMQRWALEWEWMAESKSGEFIKREELIAWLMAELKA